MNLDQQKKEIINSRKWMLMASVLWIVILWVLALAGKSSDMVDFAIGGTITTVIINLWHRVSTKLKYDKLVKLSKGG